MGGSLSWRLSKLEILGPSCHTPLRHPPRRSHWHWRRIPCRRAQSTSIRRCEHLGGTWRTYCWEYYTGSLVSVRTNSLDQTYLSVSRDAVLAFLSTFRSLQTTAIRRIATRKLDAHSSKLYSCSSLTSGLFGSLTLHHWIPLEQGQYIQHLIELDSSRSRKHQSIWQFDSRVAFAANLIQLQCHC